LNKKFTPDEVKMIFRFLKEGKTYRQLAWIFDRQEDTIRAKIKTLKTVG